MSNVKGIFQQNKSINAYNSIMHISDDFRTYKSGPYLQLKIIINNTVYTV